MKLVGEAWSDEAEAMLAPLMDDDPLCGVEGWRADVAAGRVHLIGVIGDSGALVGRVLVEVADLPGGREFAILAAVGASEDDDALADKVLPYLEQKADDLGCKRVEIATARDGLVRVLERRGYRKHRTVMVRDGVQVQ